MKYLVFLITLGVLVSCSSSKDKRRLGEKIAAEEVRSIQEITYHSEMLINEHPELEEKTKIELRSLLNVTMKKHQDLKNEESKIFQLLLEESLRVGVLSEQELVDKKALKLQLSGVYEQKSKNVLTLIKSIDELSQENVICGGFRDDLLIYMRDFR
jgi:hypothetical protein